MGVFNGFPPFVWGNHDVTGDDISLLSKFASEHALELKITIFPFMGIWNLPAENVVDVAAAGISLTPERLTSHAYWSRPYRKVSRSALVLKEASHTGYQDFKRFSVVGESVAHSHAIKHLSRTATLHFAPSIEEGVESLLRGETDAVGTGSVSAKYQALGEDRLKVIDLQRDEDAPELISFSLRREKSLLNSMNDFIASSGLE
ncbi:MAG: substrate-binding periplasmic protein [Chthoniobacterales bacterium]